MAPRTTASRLAVLVLAMLILAGASAAPLASAQSGNGLYEPFPEAAVKKRAQRYVERLGNRAPEAARRYSDAELAAGAFVRPAGLRPAGEARGVSSARAGEGADADIALPLQLLLALAVLVVPVVALTNGARARAA